MVKKIKLTLVILIGVVAVMLTGCTQSERVRSNLAQESDNFNVYRRVTVINCITGDTLVQLEGWCSIVADTLDNQLEIIAEYEQGKYSKQIIGLSDNVTYVVEDLQATNVDRYHYEINFNPSMWLPFSPVVID